jgi:hypothetical protein
VAAKTPRGVAAAQLGAAAKVALASPATAAAAAAGRAGVGRPVVPAARQRGRQPMLLAGARRAGPWSGATTGLIGLRALRCSAPGARARRLSTTAARDVDAAFDGPLELGNRRVLPRGPRWPLGLARAGAIGVVDCRCPGATSG